MDKQTYIILKNIYFRNIQTIGDFIEFTGDEQYYHNEIYLYLFKNKYIGGDVISPKECSLYPLIKGKEYVESRMAKERNHRICLALTFITMAGSAFAFLFAHFDELESHLRLVLSWIAR